MVRPSDVEHLLYVRTLVHVVIPQTKIADLVMQYAVKGSSYNTVVTYLDEVMVQSTTTESTDFVSAEMRRLARRAGNDLRGTTCVWCITRIKVALYTMMYEMIRPTIAMLDHRSAKTVTNADVQYGLDFIQRREVTPISAVRAYMTRVAWRTFPVLGNTENTLWCEPRVGVELSDCDCDCGTAV